MQGTLKEAKLNGNLQIKLIKYNDANLSFKEQLWFGELLK